MSDRFDAVPVDADTKIMTQVETKLGQYQILYQKWGWDGIVAESIIFVSKDISKLNDHEIEQEVRSSPMVKKDSKTTMSKTDSGFTLVNFNFESI
ncbi:hypothetical protein [Pseudomonas sp. N040]|uniref:hypothetical protein n=1 Tax=Pseudomonas sp. N040 TaxID=2785325 RepID=UPI0018A2717A|nr:hypothetical protein [Pseudomonas sp. N040]MBF7731120.1 hypothetical protein [Pseudomonas sp. N040]MBW7014763.1 hypothetical protein [Pseudomonas sp. N040]